MSKVATYLNEHILGEVVTDEAIRHQLSTDGSVLQIVPEMVVYPRVTNDIRKVARFAWQLAEKGHVMPLTVRGAGTDDTGGAISKGALIMTSAHMNQIFEYDTKQKLVRVQPGTNAGALNAALRLQGIDIPSLRRDDVYTTIGGAVGYNTSNHRSGKYGLTDSWVHQLEVVLANGDVLQTEKLSKRDLNKKKGLQGLEGDIYRKLDALIEDNKQLIDEQLSDENDSVGYSSLSRVKQKDGSFDLAPLIVGSQGTLGIVSEMILKTEFFNQSTATCVVTFSDSDAARDAVDELKKVNPSSLEYFDAEYFEIALSHGKQYSFYNEAKSNQGVAVVLVVEFDEFSKRVRARSVKRVEKIAEKLGGRFTTSDSAVRSSETDIVREVDLFASIPVGKAESAPPLFDGAYVPFERFEDFSKAVAVLAKKHSIALPLYARPLEGVVSTRATLQLSKVGDRQKILRLIDDYATLVAAHNGYLIGETNEGRIKALAAYKQVSEELADLFHQVKMIFDPYNILNPGVKQVVEIKELVSHLRSEYSVASIANFLPRK